MAVTIYDVAREAGVSAGTVSKVLNNYEQVSEKTRQKVTRAIKKLNFNPNIMARNLPAKSKKMIALILNNISKFKGDDLPMQIITGVYNYTTDNNLGFVLYLSNEKDQKKKSFMDFCHEKNITGAIVQGLKTTDPYYRQISQTKLPVVLIDMNSSNPKVGSVSIDNIEAERDATQLLINKGCKHLIMINGAKTAQVSIKRETGFKLALSSNGFAFDDNSVYYADFSPIKSVQVIKQAIKEHPNLDGIVCASDLMLVPIVNYLNLQTKLAVPQKIQVIGFDNNPIGEYLYPSLSSVEQNMEDVGYQSGNLLSQMFDNLDNAKEVSVPYKIIERESVEENNNVKRIDL